MDNTCISYVYTLTIVHANVFILWINKRLIDPDQASKLHTHDTYFHWLKRTLTDLIVQTVEARTLTI